MKLIKRRITRSIMSAQLNVILLLSCCAVFGASENVTTIFQLEASPTNNGVYESYGTWRIVTRNGARGFPVRKGSVGLTNVWAGTPCCETWSREGWTKLNNESALQTSPPLEVDELESADSKSLSKVSDDAQQFTKDSAGVWRGTMVPNSRVRLDFIPPESGRAALGIFLCGSETAGDVQCVAIVLTGSSENGKLLRYQATRYGPRETGSRRPTPNGNLKTFVVRRDDRVREGWLGNNSYHFQIARSDSGDYLEVQLDDGDSSQRRKMVIPGSYTFNKLAVSLLSAASDTALELRVSEDPSWQGDLPPGGSMKVSFSPSSNDVGHLGLAICEDRFREHCSAQVIDGIADGKLVRNEPAYWTPGSQEADNIPDSSKNARWGNTSSTFTLSRGHDGAITITKDGIQDKVVWGVPPNNQFLILDTYHHEGTVRVHTATENVVASVWRLDRDRGELRSPPIPESYVKGDVCVTVVARLNKGANVIVAVQRYSGTGEGRELGTLTSEAGPEWVKKRIVIPPSRILQGNKVQIVLTARQPSKTNSPLLVQWVAGCNPSGNNDEVSIKRFVPSSTLTKEIGFRSNERSVDPSDFFGLDLTPKAHSVCQNEGLINKESKCLCRPGFKGQLCEEGCGPNRFGENCESRCSDEYSPRECRGMWLCTPDLPCDCGPGLTGPRCDQPCEKGKWGVGCRQICGKCAYGNTCDRHTGWCTTACQGSLLPPFCKEECGRKALVVPFIGNGNLVNQIVYPWQVGIFDHNYVQASSNNATSTEHICGGTLISPNVVVSAAHCFFDDRLGKLLPAERYSVGFAKTKRGWDADEEFPDRVQKRAISAIHIPPEFHGVLNSKEDDIALLELKTQVNITPYVIPACFDQVGGFEEDLKKGSIGHVAGWGRTQNNIPSEELRDAHLPYISRQECLDIVPASFRPYILAKDRFCAGDQGGAFVNRGDSGGGLVFLQSNAWFLRGVVSVAPPEDKSFSAYTNVSYHRDWIVNLEQVAALRKAGLETFYSG